MTCKKKGRPPLWSRVQSSWLQIQGSGFDSWRYQIFWVVGLERGPLSLVSTFEKLLGRRSSGSGLEIREQGRGDPSSWPHDTLHPQKMVLISPTSGGLSVGVVHSRLRPRTHSTTLCTRKSLNNKRRNNNKSPMCLNRNSPRLARKRFILVIKYMWNTWGDM
jgi:hypothetical protein